MKRNSPKYADIDLLRAFCRIKDEPGRARLAEALEIGEGSVRGILQHLRQKGLIEATLHGQKYTKKGDRVIRALESVLEFSEGAAPLEYLSGIESVAAKISNAKSIKSETLLRDQAVKEKADGAIIMTYSEGKLSFRGFDYRDESIAALERMFRYDERDALVVVWAEKKKWAERGCLRIVLKLSGNVERIFRSIA